MHQRKLKQRLIIIKAFIKCTNKIIKPVDICLSCGHRKDEHSSDGSRCHNDICPCMRFKTTLLQYGSGSSNNIPLG